MSEHLERPNMNKPVFGDFVVLEMQRHRVANEYYVHEVLSQQFYSNYWRDVPIVSSQKETLHKTTEAVISVSNSFGLPIFNVRVCDILPMVGDKWCWKESPLRTRIAELEAEIDQLTARWRQERQDDKWIPVSERLPKDCELVWVRATNSPHNLPRRAFYTYRNEKWVNDEVDIDNVYSNLYVTHWMPMPESPNYTQSSTFVYGKESGE